MSTTRFLCADGPWRGHFLELSNSQQQATAVLNFCSKDARGHYYAVRGRYVKLDNKEITVSQDGGATRNKSCAVWWEPAPSPFNWRD